jgi:hypothetical protein
VQEGIPAWVSQGTRISYDGYSGFVTVVGDHKEYSSPVHTRWDVTVNKVTTDSITFYLDSYIAELPELQHTTLTHTWTYGDNYDFCIWVDPADPTSTVVAPVGMPYTFMGIQPYTLQTTGQYYVRAGLIVADILGTGTQYSITYDADTGLVLAHSFTSPGEDVYLYLISVQ